MKEVYCLACAVRAKGGKGLIPTDVLTMEEIAELCEPHFRTYVIFELRGKKDA